MVIHRVTVPHIAKLFMSSFCRWAQRHSGRCFIKSRDWFSPLVNGDLQDEAKITYWTANPEVTREAILDSWVRHVSAALLPRKMPYFNRSKWLGGEGGISWAGLLSTHHGLLVPLVQTWAQSTGIPAVIAAAPRSRPAAEVPESSQGWAAVADAIGPIGSRPIRNTSADSAFDAVDPDVPEAYLPSAGAQYQ